MPYKDIKKQRLYARNHYLENKALYLESNNRRRRELKKYVDGIKGSTPCTDCRKKYPYYVMDFDHLSDKKGLIIGFIRNNNRLGLEAEMKKCDIVCSNCHRIRTYQRITKNVE